MSSDFILEGIKDILNHGISLDLQSEEEEEEYIEVFMDWYTANTSYFCFGMDRSCCMIETKQGVPLAEIIIENSIMKIVPHTNDMFAIITEILRFIAKEHNKFIENFRGKEQKSTITDLDQINREQLDSEEEISTEEDEWL